MATRLHKAGQLVEDRAQQRTSREHATTALIPSGGRGKNGFLCGTHAILTLGVETVAHAVDTVILSRIHFAFMPVTCWPEPITRMPAWP